ncbi:ABC transporter ATP-binding protein [Actinacidiphila alni]|uniref:ABC transporter ATP-binding protein n=1 Tax=Actinacidiphila alni TaxID=380248 RepID=UPI003453844D
MTASPSTAPAGPTGSTGSTIAVSVAGLGRDYRDHRALSDVTFDIAGPGITGLVGRNGAGKTTLMRILAGQEFGTAGRVHVFGAPPWENDAVLRRMILVREDQTYPDLKVRHALAAAALLHPHWDDALAAELLEAYELPPDRPIKKLSRGMRTALGIIVGLAARAELTLFDEPYAGLDAVARTLFYDQLLADYTAHPRRIVLSTHLVDEAAELLDRVLVLDHGRIVLDAPADDLRGAATTVSGPAAGVDRFVAGRPTLGRTTLGAQARAVMIGRLDARDRELAGHLRLRLEDVGIQQLAVHAAAHPDRTAPITARAL